VSDTDFPALSRMKYPALKFPSLSKKTYMLIGVIAIIAFFSIYAVYHTEGFTDSGKEFSLIYASWCPHCKAVKPIMEEIQANPPAGIKINVIDGESGAPELASLPKVQGFPTFFLKSGGTVEEYKGGREKDDILSFLKSKA
jgi:thiol-disulfide isomerase/thioredoxin